MKIGDKVEIVTEAMLVGLQVGVMAMVLFIILMLAGCATQPRVIEKPVVVPEVSKCAEVVLPEWVPVPPPEKCMSGRVCYKTPDAAELADNIGRLREWARKIVTLCGAE